MNVTPAYLRLICVGIFVFHYMVGAAQVYFPSSHFTWHPQIDQPALMGNSEGIRMLGGYRYQWVGIDGAPMTVYAGADMKLPLKNSSGGVHIAHDRAGASTYTSAKLSYAYSVRIGDNKLNLGVQLGFLNIGLDGTKLVAPTDGISPDDDLINRGKSSAFRPEIGIGAAYIHNKFWVGASVHNLAGFKAKMDGLSTTFNADFGRYLAVQAGSVIPLSSRFSLDPGLLMRTDLVNWQLEAAILATLDKRYSLGVGARGYNNKSIESLLVLSKISISKNFSLMYSYDATLNKIRQVSGGTHEISLGYIIPKTAPSRSAKTINHPRYL